MRLLGTFVSMAFAFLLVAANGDNRGEAAAVDVAQVVKNLKQAGAAAKLDAHGKVVAVDSAHAGPAGFDFAELAALRELRSLKCASGNRSPMPTCKLLPGSAS